MPRSFERTLLVMGVAALLFVAAPPLFAQTPTGSLSGTVQGPDGPLANATVTVTSVTTGQTRQTQTDTLGHYAITNLAGGNYRVSATAPGFEPGVVSVTLAPSGAQTIDVTVTQSSPGGLSLQDLGISAAEAAGSTAEQARLDRRSSMLKIHQRLGLITAAPMLASILTSPSAKPNSRSSTSTSATGREIHGALGAATAGLYLATAYFAIRAPNIAGAESHGHTRMHKALAWVHGPGMVLTPTLGAIAYRQESRGERAHGIASIHGPVAFATFGAFAAAMLSVSIR